MSLEQNTQYKITKRVIILSLFIIGVFFFTISDPYPYVYGLIFGSSINLLNFRLMALTLKRSATMPKHKVMPYVAGNYMIRYIIYGVVLAISALADYISFYTVIIGIFMVKIIIISDTFYDIIVNKNKKGKNLS